jgi:hypothetical protein
MEGNPAQELSLAEHRERIAAGRASMAALGSVLWQVPSGGGPEGLSGLLSEVDALGMACDAGRVAVVHEAMQRGETSGGAAAMTVTQWVRHHAPSTRAGGAGGAETVVAVAQAFQKQVNAPVKEAVDAGRLPVGSAAAVVSEYEKLRPMLGELAQEPALTALVDLAVDGGPRACRRVRPFLLARYGAQGVLQDQQDLGKASSRCPNRGTPGPAPSSTGSPSTWKAMRSWRRHSGPCRRRSRSTGSATSGPRTGGVGTRSCSS